MLILIPFFSLFISNKFPTTWVYKYCFKLLYIYTRLGLPWDYGLPFPMCLGSWTRTRFRIVNILIDHIHWRVNSLWDRLWNNFTWSRTRLSFSTGKFSF